MLNFIYMLLFDKGKCEPSKSSAFSEKEEYSIAMFKLHFAQKKGKMTLTYLLLYVWQ